MTTLRARIISDGTPTGTKVFIDDQEITEHVVGLTWKIDAHTPAVAEIKIRAEIDAEAEVYPEETTDENPQLIPGSRK